MSQFKGQYLNLRRLERLAAVQELARRYGYDSPRDLIMAAQSAGRLCIKSRNKEPGRIYVYRPSEISQGKVRKAALEVFDSICKALLREGFLLAENVVRKRIATVLYQKCGPAVGDFFADPGAHEDPWDGVLRIKLTEPTWAINRKFNKTKGFRVLMWRAYQTGDYEAKIDGQVVRLADVNEPSLSNVPHDLWRSFASWCNEQKRTNAKEIRARGRYKMAEHIAERKPSFAKGVPLGHLVELVQLAVTTGYMQVKGTRVVLPVERDPVPFYAHMRTSRTCSRFDFARDQKSNQ